MRFNSAERELIERGLDYIEVHEVGRTRDRERFEELSGAIEEKLRRDFPPAERIEAACGSASEAFWSAIAAAFPEVKTGDFGPGETDEWQRACQAAVAIWLRWNHPNEQEEQ